MLNSMLSGSACLLTERPASICPHCSAPYTHVLVVAATDDAKVWGETNIEVLRANGIVEDDDDDYEDDDDQADADNPDDNEQRATVLGPDGQPVR